MASRVWIHEFGVLPTISNMIAAIPPLAGQNLDVSGGVQLSAAFNSSTRYIRIVSEVQIAIRADGSNAATTDMLLPSGTVEYFGVQPGSKISVIAAP